MNEPRDVLNRYEKQPRALTRRVYPGNQMEDVKKYPFDEKFIPVLIYMRDVEAPTDMYYEERRRAPTGKAPVISQFFDREIHDLN